MSASSDDDVLDPLTLDSFLEDLAPLSSSGMDGDTGGDHEDILDDYATLTKTASATVTDPLENDDKQAQSRYEEIRF